MSPSKPDALYVNTKAVMTAKRFGYLAATSLLIVCFAGEAFAATCRNTHSYKQWLADFKKEALANGVSTRTWRRAAPSLQYSKRIIRIDRGQRIFALSFLEFSKRLIQRYRVVRGKKLIKKHAKLVARVKRDYGVPAPVIVAFWGLESDFGASMGKDKSLVSLATLAYDCRRPEIFRPQLMAALKVIERGDLRPEEMIGSWAGELGQTQFLPEHYVNHAVDYDGDGKRHLLKSVPDVMASTARLLVEMGWRRDEPWIREVRVPSRMDWSQADVAIQHPRSYWANAGVRFIDGSALPADNVPTSLLLPMGRKGPAFLAYQNFRVYTEWNNSLVYAITAAHYAAQLAGQPAFTRGKSKLATFSIDEMKRLQRALTRRGLDVGKVDGILGVKTRAAIRKMQIKYKLPADSYPSAALMKRLVR